MSDASDIEDLLRKMSLSRRLGRWKATGVALMTFLGSVAGAGWVARGYLEDIREAGRQLKETTGLLAQQQAQIGDLLKHDNDQGTRLALVEGAAHDAREVGDRAHSRIDNILSGATLPMPRKR